jgi:hypothetical protein
MVEPRAIESRFVETPGVRRGRIRMGHPVDAAAGCLERNTIARNRRVAGDGTPPRFHNPHGLSFAPSIATVNGGRSSSGGGTVEEPGRRGRNAHTPRDPIESEGGTTRERGAQRRRKQPVVSGVLSVVARARHLELLSSRTYQHLPHDWARRVRSFVTPFETEPSPREASRGSERARPRTPKESRGRSESRPLSE